MKIDKYNKLKLKLEVFKLEKNYATLDTVLYYFSFLGNIFLIYFGYFFVKSITNTIPPLFPFQELFFTVFIALFLTGYELTKRFTLERFFTGVVQFKKLTVNIFIGCIISSLLIAGSFYLSIKGAHRLVDNSEKIDTDVTANITSKQDSISKYYDKEILYYRSQPARSRVERMFRDSIVGALRAEKDDKILKIETKTLQKTNDKVVKNEENSTAFLFITVFLEMIVLIGVGFNAFYIVGSFEETKQLLQTPKFKQLELNLKLLKLYYQNGKKEAGNPTLSFNKFKALVQAQSINCTQKDLRTFIILCQELDIIKDYKNGKKEFSVSYIEAKETLENQEVV